MTDSVHVWLIRTDLPGPVLATLAGLLDDDERRRAAAFDRPGRWAGFVAAHGATRLIVGTRLGVPPERLRWRRGPHGKPELAGGGVQVNLSHSADLALLAVSGRRRVGVDLQRLRSGLDPARMATRYYPAGEARFVATAAGPGDRARRFTALWTRKEACVKVTGGRLVPGLRLAVRGPAGDRGPIVVDPGGALAGPYLVRDLPAPPGFHAALALEGTAPYQVLVRRWPSGPPHPGPGPGPLRRPAGRWTDRALTDRSAGLTGPGGHDE